MNIGFSRKWSERETSLITKCVLLDLNCRAVCRLTRELVNLSTKSTNKPLVPLAAITWLKLDIDGILTIPPKNICDSCRNSNMHTLKCPFSF
jgi:hypothetical protein